MVLNNNKQINDDFTTSDWNESATAVNKIIENTLETSNISDFDTGVSNNSSVIANTAKVGVTTEISNVVEDVTPQLGGNLDCQSFDLEAIKTAEFTVNTIGKTEYELRLENARDSENIDVYRSMQGQAPIVVNGFLNYKSEKLNANLTYNIQGEKLVIVGSGIVPDIYEKPFHSLNFKTAYTFGKEEQFNISFSAKNLLNNKFNQFFKSYNTTNQVYRSYSIGQEFGLSFSYKIY